MEKRGLGVGVPAVMPVLAREVVRRVGVDFFIQGGLRKACARGEEHGSALAG